MIIVRITSMVILIMGLVACDKGPEYTEYEPPSGVVGELVPADILAGAPVRAVWVRETTDGSDWTASGSNLILMGYDSQDGKGVRLLHEGHANYNRPVLTPDGQQVVFSDLSDGAEVYLLDWGSEELVHLGPGYICDVWRSPEGKVWVYVGGERMIARGNFSDGIQRFPIDDPDFREWVIRGQVARDNFQLDRKGERAAAMAPQPDGGIFIMETGEWLHYGNGCWSSISPDDQGLLWIMDGRHRSVRIYDTYSEDRWQVAMSDAPGMEGYSIYYPRWGNHSRFFALSGRVDRGKRHEAEIYIGRFSSDYRHVEAWSRLTDDDLADYFPDVWIGEPFKEEGKRDQQRTRRGEEASGEELKIYEVEGVLIEKTETPSMADIAPYRRAMAVYLYEVEPHPVTGQSGRVDVAHWVLDEGNVIPLHRRQAGESYSLRLVEYENNPDFEGERVVSDVNESGILYVDLTEDPLSK